MKYIKYYFAKLIWEYDIPFLSPVNGFDWVVRTAGHYPWLKKEEFLMSCDTKEQD